MKKKLLLLAIGIFSIALINQAKAESGSSVRGAKKVHGGGDTAGGGFKKGGVGGGSVVGG